MTGGIINVYKETGYTSHDVVAIIRRLTGLKAGHAGTLDPGAEGVLPVCVGFATRLCAYIGDGRKSYRAVCVFGSATDTQDAGGHVTLEKAVTAGRAEAEEAARGFVGEYWQTPPMYSAIKVNGKKLYEAARKGEEIERAARLVRIERLTADFSDYPNTAALAVDCSKGTYIRTLCHDLGQRLGGAAHMGGLIRTRVGGFTADGALRVAEIKKKIEEDGVAAVLTAAEDALPGFGRVCATVEAEGRLRNGNPLRPGDWRGDVPDAGEAFVYAADGRLCGVYKAAGGFLKPLAVFAGDGRETDHR